MVLKSVPDCNASLDPLWASIRDAIAWCLPRVDTSHPTSCLRSEDFQPRSLQSDYFSTVDFIVSWRRRHHGAPDQSPSLANGRLLVYFPDADLCDGAAQAESEGFLDVYNCPPWDTWVGFFADPTQPECFRNYLLAWIPHDFVQLVSAGISVNPEECIGWLDDTNVEIKRLLKDNRWLHRN